MNKRTVKEHLRQGTTTCCYFACLYLPASLNLCDTCVEYGQRGFVGKVSMDRNSPDFYVEDTDAALRDAELVRALCNRRFERTAAFDDGSTSETQCFTVS